MDGYDRVPGGWVPTEVSAYQRIKATAPFVVFADAPGFTAPKFKHDTRDLAEAEARRLANLNPGINYFVLGALSITNVPARPAATTRSLV